MLKKQRMGENKQTKRLKKTNNFWEKPINWEKM
jgi:hypothetical protein